MANRIIILGLGGTGTKIVRGLRDRWVREKGKVPRHVGLAVIDAKSDCPDEGAISEAEYLAGLQRAGLGDVRVEERLVYDQAQLQALAQSEEAGGAGGACGCGACPSAELAARMAAQVEGKIWSAKFLARKAYTP